MLDIIISAFLYTVIIIGLFGGMIYIGINKQEGPEY